MANILTVPLYDISMFRGDDHTVLVTVKEPNPANTELLIPVDVTGSSSKLTVKMRASDEVPLFQKTGSVLNGTLGQLSFDIVPADTVDLVPCPYSYDTEVTLANGKVYTVLRGQLNLKEDVTTP